jgi:PKD repeat protein
MSSFLRSSFRAVTPSTLSIVALLVSGTHAGPASAQNAGWVGPPYTGAETVPTGSKAESKLWWNDGSWWGCLWSADAQSFMIHRLRIETQTWLDTGTAVDPRPKSRADCLWDGAKLYIASHQYTDGVGAPGDPLELYRYSYDPNLDRYSLDVGFPTLIGDAKTETLVIDRDSTGTLWAVWTAGLRVWTAHTVGDDRNWSVPIVHPRNGTDLDEDDIASLVAFGGASAGGFGIGVLWSDQVQGAFRFTIHPDGAPPTAWSPLETVLSGPLVAEDDLCLKAARDGRVFAALGTNLDEVRLVIRDLLGGWTDQLVTTEAESWKHPIVVLDEEERTVHVFGTTPSVLGAIHEKSASMDAALFSAGVGTPVIRDANALAVSDATSAKHSVSGATGMAVLASHQGTQRYVHHHELLGHRLAPVPAAEFHADPPAGFQGMAVQFLDVSRGRPEEWLWSFGDGATSTQRHPVHTYAQPGLYTVSLQVTRGPVTDVLTRTDLVQVDPTPTSLVLRPIADAHAFQGSPDSNRGGLDHLRIRGGRDQDYRSFLKFFVPPTLSHVSSAELRLTVVDAGSDGGSLFRVSDLWEEPTLTWNTMPALDTAPLGQFDEAPTGQSVTLDVSSVVSGSGSVSFGLSSSNFHSTYYSSRQGVAPPELRLEFQASFRAQPEANFEARRIRGTTPLTVQFADASSGRIEAWSWDFGDGDTSDLQNPSHVYRRPGRYSVSLTVTGADGTNTRTRPDFVSVRPRSADPR